MPVQHSKQNWTIGNTVKVGFLNLRVLALIPTPGDWMPDVYILESAARLQYRFTPHHGIERLNPSEYLETATSSDTATALVMAGRLFRD